MLYEVITHRAVVVHELAQRGDGLEPRELAQVDAALGVSGAAQHTAVARLRESAIPYITVLADPCTGGVSASFAAQGDVTLRNNFV